MSILLDPFQLGQLELRNRIVFAPLNTGYEENGMVTSRTLAFYRRIARGGVGMVVVGDCSVQPAMTPAVGLYDARFIPGLRQLTNLVHAEGCKIAAQLVHQEYETMEIAAIAKNEGRDAAFKRLREDLQNFVNRASLDQIRRMQDLYVAAARRAQEAGFDLVQIQGDRLIGMFCSAVINQRQDGYGGSLENRARFALEVVEKVRAALPDLPVDYRLAVARSQPAVGNTAVQAGRGGPTEPEAQRLAPWLVKAGVGSFLVCQSSHMDLQSAIPPAGAEPYGCFVELAAGIKAVVDVPVTAVGRIIKPAMAASILQQGKADLVALGRALLCDPEWPLKTEEGRETEIRECIMCNRCVESLQAQKPVICAINAQTGSGVELEPTPASAPKHVVVVGGGPAGMEAARIAALRGHHVTLLEKSRALGGQLRMATVAPYKDEMKRITAFLMREMPRLSVDVRLLTEATLALISSLAPDTVILAAGAGLQRVPQGLEPDDVKRPVEAWDVLAGSEEIGQRVIVAGAGTVGLDVALLLASQGHQVVILEAQERLGQGVASSVLPFMMNRLKEAGVQIQARHKVLSLLTDGVVVEDPNGQNRVVSCDTVVKAAGVRQPEKSLFAALESSGIPFRAIGDCAGEQARQLSDAIHEGFRAGLEV